MGELKVGLIGCGIISSLHLTSIKNSEYANLVAVCDVKEQLVKDKALEYGCRYYTDYKEMLDKEELDVVHICTPHYLHAPMTIYAAAKGINVLTEKPMSITLEDADAMIDACEENGVTLGVIFQNRYNSASTLIKKTLKSGELGKVLSSRLNVYWYRPQNYYSSSDWKGTWDKEGGGVIINQAIHTVDLVRWFVDSPVDYVDANLCNRMHKEIEVEDCAEGLIKYKNGAITIFHALTYNSCDAPIEAEVDCENGNIKLIADKATIKFKDGREIVSDKNDNDNLNITGAKNYWGTTHSTQINDYYKSVINKKCPAIDGREARKTQELVCAIYKSGEENHRVYL